MSPKRLLYLFHRWAGIVLCLILALWFFSGFFMMYVDFPTLSRAERLRGEPRLDVAAIRLTAAEAAARLTPADFRIVGTPSRNDEVAEEPLAFREVTLSSYLGRPVYTFTPENGAQPRAVLADTGEIVRKIDAARAVEAATAFATRAGLSVAQARHREVVQTDQWSVSSALNPHRPLHVVSLGDERDTVLYVSSSTGQVVRDTNATERILNYFGSVTHWIYPTVLRQYPDAWEWVVDSLAVIATIMSIAGLWIAVLRWRFKRRPGQPRIPYRGLMRWHYITGAIFGVIVVTWAFSGLLSLNPAQLNPPRSPTAAQKQLFRGAPLPLDVYPLPVATSLPDDTRELTMSQYLGQALWYATLGNGERRMIPAHPGSGFEHPDVITLAKLAPELMPGIPVYREHLLTTFDDYYYSRHPETGEKPLPVMRVEFNDADRTWFHVDPATGQLLERSTSTNRLYRWLYNGLHSFDILWLWERRPLWDVVVILFCGGGMALSVIGVIAGVRRLRFDLRRPVSTPAAAPDRQPTPRQRRTHSHTAG